MKMFRVFFAVLFLAISLSFAVGAGKLLTVAKFINHTSKEIKRNTAALLKVEETINGQCFKDEFLKRSLIQTNGKTNQQILSHITSSSVVSRLEMYRSRFTNTVGYTYPGTDKIWMNQKYHDHMGPCDVGSNLSHEILGHKLGYVHDSKPSKQRPFSVPYSIGYLVEKCCKD